MKAEIILNSYLLSKSIIVPKIFRENWIKKFFASIFEGKKNSIANFSKQSFYNSPIFFLRMILNNRNGNSMSKQSKLLQADPPS